MTSLLLARAYIAVDPHSTVVLQGKPCTFAALTSDPGAERVRACATRPHGSPTSSQPSGPRQSHLSLVLEREGERHPKQA